METGPRDLGRLRARRDRRDARGGRRRAGGVGAARGRGARAGGISSGASGGGAGPSRVSVTVHSFEEHGPCVLAYGSMRTFREGGFVDVQPRLGLLLPRRGS